MSDSEDQNSFVSTDNPFQFSAEDRLYDFFKHLTTLSLLTLGGILSIGNSDQVDIATIPFMVVTGLVAIGGISAYSGMMEIVESGLKKEKRPKRLAFFKGAASTGFGMGTGAFLSIFLMGLTS